MLPYLSEIWRCCPTCLRSEDAALPALDLKMLPYLPEIWRCCPTCLRSEDAVLPVWDLKMLSYLSKMVLALVALKILPCLWDLALELALLKILPNLSEIEVEQAVLKILPYLSLKSKVELPYLSEIEVKLADLKVLPEAPLLLIPGGFPPAPVIWHQVQHLLDIFPRCCFCVLRVGGKQEWSMNGWIIKLSIDWLVKLFSTTFIHFGKSFKHSWNYIQHIIFHPSCFQPKVNLSTL